MKTLRIKTTSHNQMIDITHDLKAAAVELDKDDGTITVYTPHTTCGVTINENADPDVIHDFLRQLEEMVPWKQPFFRHAEGNSAAHVKASMMGSSVQVIVEKGRLQLGTWQGIYLCEFDGPRTRSVFVK